LDDDDEEIEIDQDDGESSIEDYISPEDKRIAKLHKAKRKQQIDHLLEELDNQ
jgi:hypothetical protein